MRLAVAAVALLAACRGDHARAERRDEPVAKSSLVPYLPQSPDGAEEMRGLDTRIMIHASEPASEIAFLLDRATYRSRLEDYQAALAKTAALVATTPDDIDAWSLRESALAAVHDFAGARAALAHEQRPDVDRGRWRDQQTSLDEATGARKAALIARSDAAKAYPNPVSLTQQAAALALDGQFDVALSLIPLAAGKLHDNSPELFAWLLFQWGRIYEQKGDLAAARQFYVHACARLPGYLEATTHLAQTAIATGDIADAKQIVTDALADEDDRAHYAQVGAGALAAGSGHAKPDAATASNRGGGSAAAHDDAASASLADALTAHPHHPALLELAAQLGLRPVADARAEWERYVAALPLAFSDHAARFYLGAGKDPRRALVLAAQNLANRDVPEARALVVEAALAAGDTAAACDAAASLVAAPLRAHRFMAWRAFVACGRSADADRLAKDLGITP
jgi:tetratricopeptide (TPR) repeat protein